MALTTREEALEYHSRGRPGKVEINATKPCLTQIDLSLAYTPGVAEPCREIAKDPDKAFDYTARGNLVIVVTDGSAVLGLGDIGPLAGKPVMEGKAVLFKRFADIDVFDIELNVREVDEFVAVVKALEPTMAGVNLEDIAAPRCFEIERRLTEELDIPVFHDDQHGTAIITGAALINALEVAGKAMGAIRVVVNGAGAAAVACTKFMIGLGVDPAKVLMCDSKGVIYEGRTEGMNRYKQPFAAATAARTLADAMQGADVFLGVSVANTVTPAMIQAMAPKPIVLALANPDPEISWDDAMSARDDVIMATGRSDYPNQVNNVLGFPFIFRGALDARARTINIEMQMAAAQALAELAREPVPEEVLRAYNLDTLEFGREYLIPKPLDSRVLFRVAWAVAEAAMKTGVAKRELKREDYQRSLSERIGPERDIMRRVFARARRDSRRIVYPEGEHETILRAANFVARDHIAVPVLVGRKETIRRKAEKIGVDLSGMEIVDPTDWPRSEEYAAELFRLRRHKGRSLVDARQRCLDPLWFGPLMVRMGDADGMVSGVSREVRKTMLPALKVLPLQEGVSLACGMTMLTTRTGTLFLSDTALNIEPSAEDLAEIAGLAAQGIGRLGIEPVVAMLSFSSYGGTPHPRSDMVRRAVRIAREEYPDILIDGEMRVDAALDPSVQARYGKSRLGGRRANLLIFPNLEAANIGFNLVRMTADASVIGPIMLGFQQPAYLMQPHSSGVSDVVHLTALAATEARGGQRAEPVLARV